MKRTLLALTVLLGISGVWLLRASYTYAVSVNNPLTYSGCAYPWTCNVISGENVGIYPSSFSTGEVKVTLSTVSDQSIYLGIANSSSDPFDPDYIRIHLSSGTVTVDAVQDVSVYNEETMEYEPHENDVTPIASAYASFTSNTVVRAVTNGSTLLVYVNDALTILTEIPYVEGYYAGISAPQYLATTFTNFSLGALDTTPPNGISSGSISKTAYTSHIDLSWPAATDNTNGIGILQYELYRNSVLKTTTTSLSFSDTTGILPNHTYNYVLRVYDQHLNYTDTSFSVATPNIGTSGPFPSVTPEGRRVGVRPTGAYWGAGTENIDVMSGNLNFSLPLLAPQARGGWSASVGLSYNSQNWRWNPGTSTNWEYGKDIGYGFGWKLQVGSLIPVYEDAYTVDHYVFTDSTGAEYNLTENVSGVWHSRESIYVYYVAATNRLYFTNGSFWQFDCISYTGQPDQGAMYPTLLQDANGNQIVITYNTPSGAPWSNASARIGYIADIRSGSSSAAYGFTYNSDTIPHLTSITSYVGDGAKYAFTYLSSQSISSPFNSASYSANPTKHLQKVAADNSTNGTRFHQFTYNSSGEITQIELPYGGKLNYEYVTATYSTGVKHREVWKRKLTKEYTGGTPTEYVFTHESSLGADVHEWTQLDDPGGVGRKRWEFGQSGVSMGLVTKYEGIDRTGTPKTLVENDYTWSLDSNSNADLKNSFISQVLTKKDPGQTYEAQSKVTQTINDYGGVTHVSTYDFNSLSSPKRSETYAYGSYGSRYIYNLLTSTTNDLTSTTMMSISYDGGGLGGGDDAAYYDLWDPSMLSISQRGLPTSVSSLGTTTNYSYYIAGQPYASYTNGILSYSTFRVNEKFAAPRTLGLDGASSFDQTITYDSVLNPTATSSTVGAASATSYDAISRPSTSTSPFGAVTSVNYGDGITNPLVTTASVGDRWTKTTADGLGRTIKVETGHHSTTVSIVDTEYASCACSPTGKVYRTSLPYATGGTPVWTVNTYDGIGRTLSTTTTGTDTATTTSYVYEGNTVKVTDAAGRWKKYTTNVLGQLTQVNEQNPAGSGSDYVTNYTYDDLGNLHEVSMPRPSGTQTRTFNYSNSTGLLTSTVLPENGTTTYTYNSDKTLKYKVDAKGQYTGYTYDTFKRPIRVDRGTYGTLNVITVTVSPGGGSYIYPATVYLDGNSIGGVSAGYATEPQTFTYTTTAALDSLPLHVDFSSWYYYLISFKVNGNTITPTRTGSEPNYDFDYTFASEFEDATGVQGDICQREDYTYGASADDHNAGRLLSVKYRGGYNSGASPTCDTVFTETYAYSAPGAVTGKTMTVKRGSLNALDLTSTYTYDNEGRNTVVQYPPTWNGSSYANGPNRTIVYDSMGRLEKLVNTSGSPTDIISATTYSPMGQLLTMTGTSGGASSESRQYNSIGQMKRLTLTASGTAVLDMAYKFPTSGTTNDGKILSQVNELPTSASDKEEVEYQYDKLSRLALAETKTGTTSTQWGQSYAYDGFGNLTTVSTTKGSTYTLSTTYDYATNRRTSGDCADANGNLQEAAACTNGVYYDIANRVIRNEGTIAYAYSYAPGDNRVWRGVWDTSYPNAQNTDELTYYSADGAKLVAYNLTVSGSNLRASASGEYYEYFGGKLLKNSQGWVNQDRLGSIGKFFPYGQERPSATSDGTEKFATYFRDSETGLDYAQRRYHDPGDGRFLTTDPLDASAKVGDPGSWNRYTYVEGDPVNRFDPTGQFYVYPGIPDQMWCTSLLGGNLPLDCVGDWSPACLMNPWACIQGVLSGPSCSVGANGFFSAGGGNNPTNCEIPYYPPASAATPPLNCGESLAAQGLLPSSATEVALASVLLGENSWGLIGSKQYRAGDKAGRPSGSTITADTVGEENNLMLDVIANAAKARKKSLLEEASNSRRYAGYTNGSKRFVKYQQSSVGSSECNDLTQVDKAVIAFMAGGAKPRTAYNQWRAVRQGNRIVIHAGGRTAGGTDFYTISNP